MKLQKDMIISNGLDHYYSVNHDRTIAVLTYRSGEIYSIGLIDAAKTVTEWLDLKGLWYIENITEGENNEYLNTDSLMILVAQEEHGYVKA